MLQTYQFESERKRFLTSLSHVSQQKNAILRETKGAEIRKKKKNFDPYDLNLLAKVRTYYYITRNCVLIETSSQAASGKDSSKALERFITSLLLRVYKAISYNNLNV